MASKKAPPAESMKAKLAALAENENLTLFEGTPDGRNERFRASVSKFKGKFYASFRKWYANAAGDMMPGKGLSVPFDSEGLSEVNEGVAAVMKALEEAGA